VFSERRMINFLKGLNRLLFAMEKEFVLCDVEDRFLNIV
jgi:hypothetical protein